MGKRIIDAQVPINEKLLVINLQAHTYTSGPVANNGADRGGQVYKFQPNLPIQEDSDPKHSMPHLIQKKEKKPITLDGDDEVRSISSTPATGTTPTGTPASSARASPQPKEKEEKPEDDE